jgi:thymidine kinase
MGPMFSGKTNTLILRLQKRKIADKSLGRKSILIKKNGDDRYEADAVVSHANLREGECIKATKLSDVNPFIEDVNSIFIDEGQFFEDLNETVRYWISQGKDVTIAGLSTDHRIMGQYV